MEYNIILAGVGGQGVLSIAAVIDLAAVARGLRLKQAEVHGMSQRGGAVQSHLRIADHLIYSDLIPDGGANMILSMEPLETLRYVSYLAHGGVIVADRTPILNIPNYPELDDVIATLKEYPNVHLIDATGIAKELRTTQSANMVLLGAASQFLPLEQGVLESAITSYFARKGEPVVAQNIRAFHQGRAFAAN